MFPDPSTPPACYAKTLSFDFEAPDAEVGGWIQTFSRVVYLDMTSYIDFDELVLSSLIPFHGFSHILKSLRVAVPHLPSSRIFNLILSFPLLEDLAVIPMYDPSADNGDRPEEVKTTTTVQPSCPPRFTGSLELYLKGGMDPFTHRLLSRLGGIYFRGLALTVVS